MAAGDTTWRDALILDAPRIAGIPVRPLSAWHCHVAQLFEVRLGLCEDGRGPTPGDVANAIAICRSRYRQDRPGVPVAGRVLRYWLRLRWCFVDWRRDAMALCAYVAAYRRYPDVRRDGKQGTTPLGAPPYWTVAVDVAHRLPSMGLADCLNMPLLSLYALRATLVELDGGPACAWRTAVDPDEIGAALKSAQEAIDRHNAKQIQTPSPSTPSPEMVVLPQVTPAPVVPPLVRWTKEPEASNGG